MLVGRRRSGGHARDAGDEHGLIGGLCAVPAGDEQRCERERQRLVRGIGAHDAHDGVADRGRPPTAGDLVGQIDVDRGGGAWREQILQSRDGLRGLRELARHPARRVGARRRVHVHTRCRSRLPVAPRDHRRLLLGVDDDQDPAEGDHVTAAQGRRRGDPGPVDPGSVGGSEIGDLGAAIRRADDGMAA